MFTVVKFKRECVWCAWHTECTSCMVHRMLSMFAHGVITLHVTASQNLPTLFLMAPLKKVFQKRTSRSINFLINEKYLKIEEKR